MKKIISIITILSVFSVLLFAGNSYAAALDIDTQLNQTTVNPGEEVTLTIQFGQDLGAYTVNVAYDNSLFDYISVNGGTASDTSDKVIVVYHDDTGGSNPRSSMSIVFKAKEGITTSNPTEFTITATGLSNADASVTYDDITTPIVKNVTVEPEYVDYTLNLQYTGAIVKGEEKEMTLSYSSPMGRYYDHARLVAQATTPEGASVQLLATDNAQLEHDIIESGWGDAQGFEIGGQNVSQQLQVRGLFSDAGDYTITLQLIDRDNSDNVIAENAIRIAVQETAQITTPEETPSEEQIAEEEAMPTQLPKTGNNIYVPAIAVIALLTGIGLYGVRRK